LLRSNVESSNAITTRYQPTPGSSPGAELKRFASSELLKIETAILTKGQTEIRGTDFRLTFAQKVVEVNGIEPMTSCLQSRRSPN
jgi:hypothetical protein